MSTGLAEAGLIPSKLSHMDSHSGEGEAGRVRFSPDRYAEEYSDSLTCLSMVAESRGLLKLDNASSLRMDHRAIDMS